MLIGGEGGGAVLGTTAKWLQAFAIGAFIRDRIRPLATKPNKNDLLFVKDLAEAGKHKTQIDRTFPLAAVPDAFRYQKQGARRGKIVIQVG